MLSSIVQKDVHIKYKLGLAEKEDVMIITMEEYWKIGSFWHNFWYNFWFGKGKAEPKQQEWYWSWKCQKCDRTSGKMLVPPQTNPPDDIICDADKKCGGNMISYRYVMAK